MVVWVFFRSEGDYGNGGSLDEFFGLEFILSLLFPFCTLKGKLMKSVEVQSFKN